MKTRVFHIEPLERRDMLSGVTLPYSQDFSDGLPTEGWTYESSREGRIEVVNGRLRMDDYKNGSYSSRNKAILEIDLQGATDAVLTGEMWSLKDETTRSDGVFISSDGVSWTRVHVKPGTFNVELPAGTTHVKLGQYDDFPAPYDGREFDDISIAVPEPAVPQTLPYEFTGDTAGWEMRSTNDGRIAINGGTISMDDQVRGGAYSLNEAILHVDLQGQGDVYLTGSHRETNDETHSQDGVFTSSDGVIWDRVSIDEAKFDVELPSDTTMVKFSQHDNYPANSDGRSWGDILVEIRDYSQPIPWPKDLGFYTDVFNDGGAGVNSSSLPAAAYLGLTMERFSTSSWSRTRSVIAGNPTDLNGVLLFPDGQPRFRTTFINGGNATEFVQALGPDGRSRYGTYYARGGSVTGSCAGAFAVRDRAGYLALWAGDMGHNTNRSGNHSVSFAADVGHPFTDYLVSHNGTTTIPNVGHYYGPIIKESYRHAPGSEFLGTIYNTPSSIRRSEGSSYILAYKKTTESGRLVVQVSHPESYSSGPRLGLMAAMIQYSLDATGVPDVKGTLTIGSTLAMNKADEKIGDKQYHRYTIDVTQPTTISVTGGVTLYAQQGSGANARSYQHKGGSITLPGTGTWEVSAYGNHEIKNGVAYTLSTIV